MNSIEPWSMSLESCLPNQHAFNFASCFFSSLNSLDSIMNYHIERENVTLLGEIGRGNFGVVMEGSAVGLRQSKSSTTAVAVKLVETCTNQQLKALKLEFSLAVGFSHDNILSPVAICLSGQPVMILFPLMINGDLKAYLRQHAPGSRNTQQLSSNHLLHFALGVSFGVEYLAKAKFVHRDISARNVVLDSKLVPKIADFGNPEVVCLCWVPK
jgi:serine/threonine protein kinase